MDSEGGNPFWIIAIIVIAFINWLSETLKARQEKRRAERERLEYIRQKAAQGGRVVDSFIPGAEEEAEEEYETQESIRLRAEEQLKSFFDSLSGRAPEPEPEPFVERYMETPAAVEPPPVPSAPRALSAAEKESLASYETILQKKARRHRTGKSSIRDQLSTPGAARQAFLLKEILDTPKGLEFKPPASPL